MKTITFLKYLLLIDIKSVRSKSYGLFVVSVMIFN